MLVEERHDASQPVDVRSRCPLGEVVEVGQRLRADRLELERRPDAVPARHRARRRQEPQLAAEQGSVLEPEVRLDRRQRRLRQVDEDPAEASVARRDHAAAHLRREDLPVDRARPHQQRQ